MTVTLRGTTIRNQTAVEAWSPSVLFANNEPGAWYAPNDIPVNWRRNLLTYTEQFDNAAWQKTATGVAVTPVVTANAGTAPDGTTTADRIQFDCGNTGSSSNRSYVSPNPNVTYVIGSTYTGSIYVKAFDVGNVGRTIRFSIDGLSTTVYTLTADWVRVSITGTASAASSNFLIETRGTFTTQTADVLIWGAQLDRASAVSAYQQIVTPEISFLDYQRMPSMYQDSIGTTPVWGVEQAVGLILDESRGMALGLERITNGSFDTDSAWGKDAGWTIGSGVATFTSPAAGNRNIFQTGILSSGKFYQVVFTITSLTAGSFLAYAGGITSPSFTTTGVKTCILGPASDTTFLIKASTDCLGSIDNISVREIAGTHRIQPTAASRPILRARYNLLTYSEQFDNAAWTKTRASISANAATAPDGTTTADKLVEDSTASNSHLTFNATVLSVANTTSYTYSIYAKPAGRNWLALVPSFSAGSAYFDIQNGVLGTVSNGAASITPVGDGWYLCRLTVTSNSTSGYLFTQLASANGTNSYTGDGTSGIFIWGADLRSANDTYLPYQWIAAATDYNTVGFPVYLSYDGSDDSHYTGGNLDMSTTDKVAVFTGVTKLSDAAAGILAELGATDAAAGAFGFQAPNSSTNSYRFVGGGSNFGTSVNATGFPAPATNVVTSLGDISGDTNTIRVDGAQIAVGTSDQGTGNYASAVLNIGRRNNASLPFNGREYQTIIVGRTLTATEITRTERYVATTQGRNL